MKKIFSELGISNLPSRNGFNHGVSIENYS